MTDKIGAYLARKRMEQALSKEELAQKVGVSQARIAEWESGKRLPGIFQLEPLCSVLGCTVTQLLAGEEAANADEVLLKLLRKLEKYKALGIALVGLLLTQLPLTTHYAAEARAGQFVTGLLTGISVGVSLLGVFLFAYGLVQFLKNQGEKQDATSGKSADLTQPGEEREQGK